MGTFVVVAGAVVVDDQLTKALAQKSGAVAGNPALAFGVVEGSARLLSLGMIVVLVAFLRFVPPRAAALGIWPATPALIAGGMFANLVDRLRFGVTRDFILTPWATVNVADIAVIVGVVVLFVAALRQMKAPGRPPNTAAELLITLPTRARSSRSSSCASSPWSRACVRRTCC